MQRDLKIGMSLCLLMFGVVGALMFRREQPAVAKQGLQPKTARQLDQKIAQRPRTPYMTGMTGEIEHDDDADPSKKDPQDGTRPAHLLPPTHLIEEDDGILAPHPMGRHSNPIKGLIGRSHDEAAPRVVTEEIVAGLQTHTIRSGDTLSSIAEKYLGSQKRFQEIFDANRTVLANPNRLPEGVVISIPPASKEFRHTTLKPTGTPVSQQGPSPQVAPATQAGPRPQIAPTPRIDIDDQELTTFEPIAPPPETDDLSQATGVRTTENVPGKSSGDLDGATEPPLKKGAVDKPLDSNLPDPKPVDSAPAESRKRFFAPSRLPFGTHPTSRTGPARTSAEAGPGSPTVSKSSANNPESDQASGPKSYLVRKGDSLERISQKVYGTPKRASEIYNANRDRLARPDAIREGLELELP